jgi:peroxiredoxin
MKLSLSLVLILICSFAVFAQQSRGKTLAENFTAFDTNGESIELQTLRGKVVVLTFWSTKCAICQAEIPKLNKLSVDNTGKEVVFLALTMNNEATVNAFVKKNPFNFHLLPNSFGVVLKYADRDNDGNIAMGFPAHFLINQNGEIELKTSGFDKTEQLNAEINRLLSLKKTDED